jgi:L-iditol 2-dehydrogenase
VDRRRMLNAAGEFARDHPELLSAYVTHTFSVDDVQQAFELANRPAPDRIKIALVR